MKCGSKFRNKNRYTRHDLVEMAKKAGITNIYKKNMNILCNELGLNKKEEQEQKVEKNKKEKKIEKEREQKEREQKEKEQKEKERKKKERKQERKQERKRKKKEERKVKENEHPETTLGKCFEHFTRKQSQPRAIERFLERPMAKFLSIIDDTEQLFYLEKKYGGKIIRNLKHKLEYTCLPLTYINSDLYSGTINNQSCISIINPNLQLDIVNIRNENSSLVFELTTTALIFEGENEDDEDDEESEDEEEDEKDDEEENHFDNNYNINNTNIEEVIPVIGKKKKREKRKEERRNKRKNKKEGKKQKERKKTERKNIVLVLNDTTKELMFPNPNNIDESISELTDGRWDKKDKILRININLSELLIYYSYIISKYSIMFNNYVPDEIKQIESRNKITINS